MARILVDHGTEGWSAGAPIVTALVTMNGVDQDVQFLVDTGAASTSLNPAEFPVKDVWSAGEEQVIGGVGGSWPVRRYHNVEMVFQLSDGRDVRITAPSLDIPSPYIDPSKGGKACMVNLHFDKRTRKPRNNPCYEAPALLGRDFFKANGLHLFWDPNGDVYIEVPVAEAVVEVQVGEPQEPTEVN